MTSSSDWAIEARGLVKTFGSNRAVDGVDLSVRVGTIDVVWSLVGAAVIVLVFAPLTVCTHMRKA